MKWPDETICCRDYIPSTTALKCMYTTLHPTQKHLCLPQSTSPMSKLVAVTMAQMRTDKRRGKKGKWTIKNGLVFQNNTNNFRH